MTAGNEIQALGYIEAGGTADIKAEENVTVADINATDIYITSNNASILDDEDYTTFLSLSSATGTITLTAKTDIGSTDGQAGIRPGFIDIDTTNLSDDSITLTGDIGSDIYLNFLNGDFSSSYLAAISPNNTSTENSINSLTIGATDGDLEVNSDIFNQDDLGNPGGIYYDLYLLTNNDLTLSNSIETNEDILELGAGGDLTLTMGNITFNNPDGTLILWADFDQDGSGTLTGGSSGAPITLTNVENLILIAGSGINVYTAAAPINIAAYNSTLGEINIDNIGDMTIFDGTDYVGVPGIDVNGVNNESGGDVNIRAHSDVNINAPINTFGGNLNVSATESITHNALGYITTSGGNYTGIADSDHSSPASGAYTMVDGATINTVDTVAGTAGYVLITAGEDISVTGITATGNTVALETTTGGIIDAGDTEEDIIANQAVLVAINGIGNGNALETDISNISAFNAGTTGNIELDNKSSAGLTVNSVVWPWIVSGIINLGGGVTINEGTPIIVDSPILAKGAISLTANDTALDDGYIDINNTITSSDSSVTLIADDDIDMGANVNAKTTLTMTADADGSGVGSIIQTAGTATGPTMNLSGVAIGSTGNPLSIDAATLTAQADEDIYLAEENDITLASVTTNDGIINITSGVTTGGEMNAVYVATGNDNNITLTANDDDITITTVNAGNGDVVITATNGNIGNAGGTVTANNLTLTATGNIQLGTSANTLQATGNGIIIISEADDLALADINGLGYSVLNSGNGITEIATGGDLTISDDIQSASAEVVLDSGANILQNADIYSGADVGIDAGGTFTMAPDTIINAGDSDIEIGDNNPIGGTVTLGLLKTTGDVEINTSADVLAAANTDVEIVADELEINAGGSVGLGNQLDTDVRALTANVDNNDLVLYEADGLLLNNVNTGTGDVTLVLEAGTLESIGTTRITADEAFLTAPDGIAVNTDINELTAETTNNNIKIVEDNGLGINNINAGSGDVDITLAGILTSNAGTGITANDLIITGDGAIDINTNIDTLQARTNNADITVTEDDELALNLVDAGTGDVTLTAGGAITDNNGAGNNVSAGNLTLNVVGDVGTSTDSIDTNIGSLTITAAGNAYISENDGIILNNVNIGTLFALETGNNGSVTSAGGTKITATSVNINADGAVDINTNIGNITVATSNDNVKITEDDGLVLNDIDAGSGDVDITLAGTLTSNTGTGITANDLIITGDGAININTNVDTLQASTNNANITVNETSGLALKLVDAGTGDVTLTAGGAITDGNEVNVNIIGNDLVLTAVSGIGSGNALETKVDTLQATNTNNGIEIINTGALALNNTTPLGHSVQNTNGLVNIKTTSPLNVNANVNAGGDITLIAGEISDAPTYADDIGVNANITSTGGNIYLYAGDDIIQSTGTWIQTQTTGKTVTLTASYFDQDNHGGINSTGAIQTNNGDINISAKDNIALNSVNANAGNMEINSTSGAITATALTANNLDASAEDGINVSNSALNTLTANVTETGDITFGNEGGQITLTSVQTPNGDISITAGGDILVTYVSAIDHQVSLTSSGGGILDNNATATNDIFADNLIISAVTGIGSTDALETEVGKLAAQVTAAGTGNIKIINTGDLVLDNLAGWGYAVKNNGTGTIDITVMSNLTVDDPVISSGGNIILTANSGAIIQNATGDITTGNGNFIGNASGPYQMADGAIINTTNGTIDIDAGGDITIGQLKSYSTVFLNSGGAILDGGDTGGEDIQASAAELIAATGIGNGNALETSLTNLAANSTTGPININETSDLTIATVGLTTGITTTGDINLNIGNSTSHYLLLNNNNDIKSNGGDINIDVAGALVQWSGANIISGGGDIDITADYLEQQSSNANSTIQAGAGNVDVYTGNGGIRLDSISGNNVTLSTSGAIYEYMADGGIDIDITATNLIMDAVSGIGSSNALETVVSSLNAYNSTSGNINISNTGDLTIDNFASINASYGVKNDGGAVNISSTGSIDIPGTNGDGIYAVGNITLTAGNDITGGSSGNGIYFAKSNSGGVTLNAGNDIHLGQFNNYSDIYAEGDITLTAGNDITVDVCTYVRSYSGDISFDAGKNINLITRVEGDETWISADNGILSLTAEDITIVSAETDSGSYTTMEAGNNIILFDSEIYSNDYIEMEAGNNIILFGGSGVFARSDAYLSAGNYVDLGYVVAGNLVDITAGEITDNNGDDVNIVSDTLNMTAANGIGSADGLETEVSTLSAVNTANNIWIINGENLIVNGASNLGGDIIIENDGDITIANLISASDSVLLYANGSILDGNNLINPNALDIRAGDTSELMAFDGTVGTWNDPVEVNITGDLYVYGSDEDDHYISVMVNGVVQPRDILLSYPGYTSSGLIFFNGRMNGGARSNQWFRAVSPSVQYIGLEPSAYSDILLQLIKDTYFNPVEPTWKMDKELEESLDIVLK